MQAGNGKVNKIRYFVGCVKCFLRNFPDKNRIEKETGKKSLSFFTPKTRKLLKNTGFLQKRELYKISYYDDTA